MTAIKVFTDLEIWKKARALENNGFRLTYNNPLAKDFDLKNQMNRHLIITNSKLQIN